MTLSSCASAALSILLAAAAATPVTAQGASDIFVAHIRPANTAGTTLTVDSVTRVTNRNGYNNQPGFLKDGRTIVYTAIDSSGQADIWQFDLRTRTARPVTRTSPESEYSATPMPGADRISVIRVERDSTQRLWSFTLAGADPMLVLKKTRPVGYQSWVDANRIVVFVLGSPATLQLLDIRNEHADTIALNPGRALQRVPGRAAVSFTRRDSANVRWIEVFDVADRTTKKLVKSFPENEYHAWLPSGVVISARGSSLYQFNPATDTDWVLVADLTARGVRGITRIATSADGRMIAIVAAH
jgi:hypothetical protein